MSRDSMTPAPDPWHVSDVDVDLHLELLGLERSEPDLALLAELHRRHVHTFPFANVDVLLGDHPGVAPATVSRRLLVERTGGYCFEHAQLFAATCESLGFAVTRRLGRVHSPVNTRTHMAVEVQIEDTRLLCDPGFGLSITEPMRMSDGAVRHEAHGEYSLHRGTAGGAETWELRRRDSTAHVIDTLPVVPADVRGGHVITSRDPDSGPFTHHLIVSRFMEEGHFSLADTALTIRREGDPTERRDLTPAQSVDTARGLGASMTPDRAATLRRLLEQNVGEDGSAD
ncbi:arylamine N-acetyltransferase family protein [Brachybacterium kimchii]|uniref:Arylamine N-acetyltransferase n=1 Tax=Brachybacterium kimchii TaxID=2942909 RepID=A0ABY4N4B6_9MICO|nr:arylamine N-acetyltransferase [Brachybacterium kimchii]UQN29398.1 arylamine N-acetyltransferase [Brachybacterium kimchii]